MHENENLAPKIFVDENSMHKHILGKIFISMHRNNHEIFVNYHATFFSCMKLFILLDKIVQIGMLIGGETFASIH